MVLRRIIVLSCLILAAVGPSKAWGQFFFFENPLVGEQAPDFTLNTVNGKDVNLTKFRDGNAAIVFFWATWCPHCRVQLKELNGEGPEMEKRGIKIVLVDLEEGAEQVRSYLEKHEIQFNVFLDSDAAVSQKYGIVGVPTYFFIDKSGIVQAVEHEIPENYEEILLLAGEQQG